MWRNVSFGTMKPYAKTVAWTTLAALPIMMASAPFSNIWNTVPLSARFLICMSLSTTNPSKETSLLFVHWYDTFSGSNTSWDWTICNCFTCNPFRNYPYCYWYRENGIQVKACFLIFWKPYFRITWHSTPTRISEANSIPIGLASSLSWWTRCCSTVGRTASDWRTSITLSYKVEAKGKDRDDIAFFAKFVLCSNTSIWK